MADTFTSETGQDLFGGLSIGIRVSVGTAHPSVQELMALDADSVLSLDRGITDEVELFVGEKYFASGILEETTTESGSALQVRIVAIGERQ